MSNLPVIIGFGGINASGRTSSHHGYRRLVLDHLDTLTNKATFYNGLFYLAGEAQGLTQAQLTAQLGDQVKDATLIRPIRTEAYDVEKLVLNKVAQIVPASGDCTCIRMRKRHLPNQLPDNWQVSQIDGDTVEVTISGGNFG